MAGSGALFDTNILIDYTRGIPGASEELARYERCAISVVTWMEVLAGEPVERQQIVRDFLATFELIGLHGAVAEETIRIRRGRKLRLPDAMVLATARVEKLHFVTRNTRDFEEGDEIRIPYRLQAGCCNVR